MPILLFFIAHWYLSLFAQTFFLHRYAAHRMFTMSPFWEKFFYFFTAIAQGSSYLSPRTYAILHRMHHAYADKEGDPHSPKYSTGIIDMFIKTWKVFDGIKRNQIEVEPRFTKDVPHWAVFDAIAFHWSFRLVWCAAYTVFYIHFMPEGWEWLYILLPLHFMMGPLHGVIINWFAHKTGYVNHKVSDTSVNMMPVDLFMMGEGLHNNHHKFPARANFGNKWYEFDPSYPLILLLRGLGIIRMNNSGVAYF